MTFQGAANWPNATSSRRVRAGGLDWFVQVAGAGPVLLLLHGTGASTHSWRDMLPRLARLFTVVAPDLPGHHATKVRLGHRLSLPAMAQDVGRLLAALEMRPALAAGHSAGAAILARMCIDGLIAPAGLVSLNGAMLPLAGSAGQIFAPLARLLAGLPILPQLFAWQAGTPRVARKLLEGTGSSLDEAGVALYARLLRDPDHAAAALRMMANWDLQALVRDLARLQQPVLLVAGSHDRAIPPADARRIAAIVPHAEVVTWPGLGHLAHEERPDLAASLIEDFARKQGVL